MLLITGSSGHLGANLVRRLVDDGHDVRVFLRHGSNNAALDGLAVERVYGDLRDIPSVMAAVQGCERIHHCAAKVSTTAGQEREIFECNVIGTRNLLRAALDAGVSRVVVSDRSARSAMIQSGRATRLCHFTRSRNFPRIPIPKRASNTNVSKRSSGAFSCNDSTSHRFTPITNRIIPLSLSVRGARALFVIDENEDTVPPSQLR